MKRYVQGVFYSFSFFSVFYFHFFLFSIYFFDNFLLLYLIINIMKFSIFIGFLLFLPLTHTHTLIYIHTNKWTSWTRTRGQLSALTAPSKAIQIEIENHSKTLSIPPSPSASSPLYTTLSLTCPDNVQSTFRAASVTGPAIYYLGESRTRLCKEVKKLKVKVGWRGFSYDALFRSGSPLMELLMHLTVRVSVFRMSICVYISYMCVCVWVVKIMKNQ